MESEENKNPFPSPSITDADNADVARHDRELKELLHKNSLCKCDCPECLASNCTEFSNPDCVDWNCYANFSDESAELTALKQLATSLTSLIA